MTIEKPKEVLSRYELIGFTRALGTRHVVRRASSAKVGKPTGDAPARAAENSDT